MSSSASWGTIMLSSMRDEDERSSISVMSKRLSLSGPQSSASKKSKREREQQASIECSARDEHVTWAIQVEEGERFLVPQDLLCRSQLWQFGLRRGWRVGNTGKGLRGRRRRWKTRWQAQLQGCELEPGKSNMSRENDIAIRITGTKIEFAQLMSPFQDATTARR